MIGSSGTVLFVMLILFSAILEINVIVLNGNFTFNQNYFNDILFSVWDGDFIWNYKFSDDLSWMNFICPLLIALSYRIYFLRALSFLSKENANLNAAIMFRCSFWMLVPIICVALLTIVGIYSCPDYTVGLFLLGSSEIISKCAFITGLLTAIHIKNRAQCDWKTLRQHGICCLFRSL